MKIDLPYVTIDPLVAQQIDEKSKRIHEMFKKRYPLIDLKCGFRGEWAVAEYLRQNGKIINKLPDFTPYSVKERKELDKQGIRFEEQDLIVNNKKGQVKTRRFRLDHDPLRNVKDYWWSGDALDRIFTHPPEWAAFCFVLGSELDKVYIHTITSVIQLPKISPAFIGYEQKYRYKLGSGKIDLGSL